MKLPPGQDWVTEDGFAGFDGLDDFGLGGTAFSTGTGTPTE